MNRKSAITIAALLLAGSSAFAQELKTSYFLDNYIYAHHTNAALQPGQGTKGYFSIGVGGISVAPQMNVGLNSFLFPVDGKLDWGFSSKVPAATFLGKLNDMNTADVLMDVNLLSFGFRVKEKSFINVEFNVKSATSLSIPKDLFALLKEGSTDGKTFNIHDINVLNREYAELAVNFSTKFGADDQFSVGATLKGLMGLANVQAAFNSFDITMKSSEAIASANGQLEMSIPWAKFDRTGKGYINLNTLGFNKFAPAGFGAAIDLGFHWNTPLEGLSVDLGVNDIGGISWVSSVSSKLNFSKESFGGGTQKVMEKIAELGNLKLDNASSSFKMLPTVLNVGTRYRMPFYNRLSAGLLGSFRFGDIKYNEVLLGLDVTPADWFGFALSGGYTSFGWTMGSAINFRLPVVNLYLAVDGIPTRYAKNGIPISRLNTVFKAGLVFTIGNNKL